MKILLSLSVQYQAGKWWEFEKKYWLEDYYLISFVSWFLQAAAFMGCAITSAVFGGIIIICFSISIAMYRTSPWYEDDFYQRYWYNYDAEMAVTVITLILGIVEFGIGIWAAVLCCNMNACQCCAVQGGQVLYIYWVNFALSAPVCVRAFPHWQQSCLFQQIFCHGQHFTSADGLSRLDKFWPKQTNLQMHCRQNLSRVK